MGNSRRTFLQLAGASALATMPLAAMAETNLNFIVPLGSGGALDRLARRVAEHLPDVSDYNVRVENRPIADGSDGYRDFLGSPADGSTVLVWFQPAAANYEHGFDLADLSIINVQEIEPPILAARRDLGWTSLADFVAEARRRPNELRFGAGGNQLIALRQFEQLGIKVRSVEYGSGGKARAGLLSGEIDLTMGSLKAIRKLGDNITPLAIMAPRRLRLWPEIPTIVEAVKFAEVKPIFGAAYRFFAVHRDVEEKHPGKFEALVSAFEQLTLKHEPFRQASGGHTRWFGPVESTSLVARAHAQFAELKRSSIIPATYPKK